LICRFANGHDINFESASKRRLKMSVIFTTAQLQVLYTCFNVGAPGSTDFASHDYPVTEVATKSVHDKLEAAVADGQLAVDLTDEERDTAWMCFDVGADILAVRFYDVEVNETVYRQLNAKLHAGHI
jgi:hypothetical protein